MILINAFLIGGLICVLGQLLLDFFKLTPGHVTTILVVIGALLSFFGLYEPIREIAGMGASIPIMSFGDLLYQAAWNGLKENGLVGLFNNIMTTTSLGISSAIIISFLLSLVFKAHK